MDKIEKFLRKLPSSRQVEVEALTRRGFVGLLGLLITAAVIVFLAVKILMQIYRVPSEPNILKESRSIIEQAEDAKRLIEQRSGI